MLIAGYASHVIDGDRVLAGRLRSVAIERTRVLLGSPIKQGEIIIHFSCVAGYTVHVGSYGIFCCGTLLHSSHHGEEVFDEQRRDRQSQLGEEVFVKAITGRMQIRLQRWCIGTILVQFVFQGLSGTGISNSS